MRGLSQGLIASTCSLLLAVAACSDSSSNGSNGEITSQEDVRRLFEAINPCPTSPFGIGHLSLAEPPDIDVWFRHRVLIGAHLAHLRDKLDCRTQGDVIRKVLALTSPLVDEN